jgi:hypothetical protein
MLATRSNERTQCRTRTQPGGAADPADPSAILSGQDPRWVNLSQHSLQLHRRSGPARLKALRQRLQRGSAANSVLRAEYLIERRITAKRGESRLGMQVVPRVPRAVRDGVPKQSDGAVALPEHGRDLRAEVRVHAAEIRPREGGQPVLQLRAEIGQRDPITGESKADCVPMIRKDRGRARTSMSVVWLGSVKPSSAWRELARRVRWAKLKPSPATSPPPPAAPHPPRRA